VFGSNRVKLDPELLARAIRELEDAGDEQELKRRLKGLGYLS
jgi:hypothetical protein